MTLGEMKSDLISDLRLGPGCPLYGDPWRQDRLFRKAADHVAFRAWALYGAFTAGLTADQARYCSPDFFELDTVYVKDAGGQWKPLKSRQTSRGMDFATNVQWRNAAAADPPTMFIPQGSTEIVLWPTPSVTRAAAVTWEGYYKPGAFWTYDSDGNGVALSDTDECPLASWAHQAVFLKARLDALEDETRPEILKNEGKYKADLDDEMDEVRAKAAKWGRKVTQYNVIGPWAGLEGG